MHPIFIARGPDFANRKGDLAPFSNIDLYSLTCHLLQLTPAPNNGSLTPLQPYLGEFFLFFQSLSYEIFLSILWFLQKYFFPENRNLGIKSMDFYYKYNQNPSILVELFVFCNEIL